MTPSGRVIQDLEYRLPRHGQIRVGKKNEKGYPQSLKTFRFTSSDRSAIDAVAAEFGGAVSPWMNGKNPEFEVITEAAEIPVFLPPDPIDGPIFEFWSGGGKLFECDRVTCIKTVKGPDGPEFDHVPCRCLEEKKDVCVPMTRLNVLLANVQLGGAWQLRTQSKNAAHELPAMVQIVAMMTAKTLMPAKLALEARTSKAGGQVRHYSVPVLRSGSTLHELTTEQETIAQLEEAGPILEIES
jgi:hypothetical protein